MAKQKINGDQLGTISGAAATALAITVGNLLMPVGFLLTSTSSTNPGTSLGFGTWSAYAAGKVIVGKASSGTFGTAGATGGAETHTLTTTEMPAHSHTLRRDNSTDIGVSGGPTGGTGISVTGTMFSNSMFTSSAGSGGSHNNLQPYVVVYIWQRTA